MSMTINSMNSLFSSIFGWNSQNSDNSSQTMFGQDSNLGINLSDYASIKSGAYHKLLKAYYENVPDDDKKTDSSSKKNTQTTQKEKVEELTRVENAADDVKDAADALLTQGNKSVFHKVEKTGTDGKTTLGYDTDAIYNDRQGRRFGERACAENDAVRGSEYQKERGRVKQHRYYDRF